MLGVGCATHTGLSEEGLFRVPGTAEDVKIIKRDYDTGTSAHTQRAAHASTRARFQALD